MLAICIDARIKNWPWGCCRICGWDIILILLHIYICTYFMREDRIHCERSRIRKSLFTPSQTRSFLSASCGHHARWLQVTSALSSFWRIYLFLHRCYLCRCCCIDNEWALMARHWQRTATSCYLVVHGQGRGWFQLVAQSASQLWEQWMASFCIIPTITGVYGFGLARLMILVLVTSWN